MRGVVNKFKAETAQGSSPFSFAFLTEDGSPLLQSRRYKSKDSAFKGVRAVQKHCLNDKYYLVKTASDEKYYFEIKSANGAIIVSSVSFSSEEEMKQMIKHIKVQIPNCDVDFQQSDRYQ